MGTYLREADLQTIEQIWELLKKPDYRDLLKRYTSDSSMDKLTTTYALAGFPWEFAFPLIQSIHPERAADSSEFRFVKEVAGLLNLDVIAKNSPLSEQTSVILNSVAAAILHFNRE